MRQQATDEVARTRSDAATGFTGWANRFGRGALAIAVLAALALALAGPGHRLGLYDFMVGFTLLKWSIYGAAAALLLALTGTALALWRGPRRALLVSLTALVIALGTAAVPLGMLVQARSVPPINDITTDPDDPPVFEAILPLRAGAPNSADYPGRPVADQQRVAYPEIQPIEVALPPDAAFEVALATIETLDWTIVARDLARGRIEATDTTFWFGFVDDIVIRVRPEGAGSRIDLRSVSRVGVSDLGKNAERIRTFIDEFNRRLAEVDPSAG